MIYDQKRLHQICKRTVQYMNLNLNGMKVVTEAANGFFSLTPLIALIAGAREVICLGRDTPYGLYDDIKNELVKLANQWCLPHPIITNNRVDVQLQGADILTNLGMVRPINLELLQHIGSQVVISYMCEAWEIREADVDFMACRQMNIPVMGTDEKHPIVGVFQYCGMLAVKLILEAGFEVINNRIAILSSDNFGIVIQDAIHRCGGEAVLFTNHDAYRGVEYEKWDVVLISEYNTNECILGNLGRVSGQRLNMLLDNTLGIVQFAGYNAIDDLYKNIYPYEQLQSFRMARTLDYLGPQPLVLLHTAGFSVGQKMVFAKRQGLTGDEFAKYVLAEAPAQIILA